MPKPIKRHQALQPISREHHHGLLLSWKIREGFKLGVPPNRIKKYTDWFWENHLIAHFDFEEKYIFTLFDMDNTLIKRALREHRRLKKLFTATDKIAVNLSLLEEELVAHIRFEERILFQEVQKIATEKQFKHILEAHDAQFVEDYLDEFWVSKTTTKTKT